MKFLFDLGGVFFDWNPRYFYRDIFSNIDELDFFLSEICNDEWNIKQDEGRSIKEAENEIISKFPHYEKQIEMYYANHHKMIKSVYANSIETLNKLKKNQYLCYVLSNWSAEMFVGMHDKYPFLNKFEDILISGNVRLIKPNPEIFKLAINRFDLEPKKTVFIDDKLENVDAAKKLGFNILHLVNPTEINLRIKKYLT